MGTRGELRDNALKSGWFFLELMIKAMIEHLATTDRLNANRKHRFSEQFHNDIIDLTNEITRDIVNRRGQNDTKLVDNLNSSLAFFLHDLLSVMDRGFVFALIRSYSKDITAKGKMFFHMKIQPKSNIVWFFQKISFNNLHLLQTIYFITIHVFFVPNALIVLPGAFKSKIFNHFHHTFFEYYRELRFSISQLSRSLA